VISLRKERVMRRALPWILILFLLLIHTPTTAMGEKKAVPPRDDKITYDRAVEDHPQLAEMVTEEGFNNLDGREQWELITMVDKYAFFRHEGEYYAGESPSQSMIYLRKAKALNEEIRKRFGHVLK
jgi:hypothetical protein